MKKSIFLLFLLVLMPFIAMAELSDDEIKNQVSMLEKELELGPFIKQIQNGEVNANQTAILYAILQNTNEVCIHQQNGEDGNQVFLHQDGHSEVVYDENGELVLDGINEGTYNYYHPSEEPLYHFSFDICPWIMWGLTPTDSTTVKSRIYAYMGDLDGGIRRTFSQKSMSAMEWKSDGQIQALAIFISAIQQGNAESFFTLFEKETITTEQYMEALTRLNLGLEMVFLTPEE